MCVCVCVCVSVFYSCTMIVDVQMYGSEWHVYVCLFFILLGMQMCACTEAQWFSEQL